MDGDIGKLDALDLHALEHLAREVEPRGRCCHGTLVLGVDTLEVGHVFFSCRPFVYDVVGQGSFSQGEELALELVVRAVVEEAQGASAARCVVNHFGHHRSAVVEEELVADANLACWFDKHVPQAHFLVQLAQQEYLYLGVGLLLCAVEACGEHLCVVEDERIALVEVVENVAEVKILLVALVVGERFAVLVGFEQVDGLRLLVKHHQAAFVTMEGRVQGDELFRQFEFEL